MTKKNFETWKELEVERNVGGGKIGGNVLRIKRLSNPKLPGVRLYLAAPLRNKAGVRDAKFRATLYFKNSKLAIVPSANGKLPFSQNGDLILGLQSYSKVASRLPEGDWPCEWDAESKAFIVTFKEDSE